MDKKKPCKSCGLLILKSDLKSHKVFCELSLNDKLIAQETKIDNIFSVLKKINEKLTNLTDPTDPKDDSLKPVEMIDEEIVLPPIIADSSDLPDPIEITRGNNTNLFIFSYHNIIENDVIKSSMYQFKRGKWMPVSYKIIGKLITTQNLTQLL